MCFLNGRCMMCCLLVEVLTIILIGVQVDLLILIGVEMNCYQSRRVGIIQWP
jgi:hypothetical protein